MPEHRIHITSKSYRDKLGRFVKGRKLPPELEKRRLERLRAKLREDPDYAERLRRAQREVVTKKINLEPTPTLSYVLGVLLGDGYVYTTHIKGVRRCIVGLGTVSEDFAKSFAQALASLGMHPRIRVRKPQGFGKKPRFEVESISAMFYDWYKELTLEDIKKIVSTDKEHIIAFIKGFYESEGSLIIKDKERGYLGILLSNTNKKLLELVKELLQTLGFNAKLYGPYKNRGARGNTTEYRVALTSTSEVERFIKVINPCIKKKRK